MGNIKIDTIKNEELKALAEKANMVDADKTTLNDAEVTIFKALVEAKNLGNVDEFKTLMGGTTTPAEIETAKYVGSKKEERIEKKESFDAYKRQLTAAAAESKNIEELMNAEELDAEQKAVIEKVKNLLPEYETVKDVEKAHRELAKKVNGKEEEFALKVLEAVAKKEILNEQKQAFVDLVADEKAKNPKLNEEQILKGIEKDERKNDKLDRDERQALKSYRKNEYVANSAALYNESVAEVVNDKDADGNVVDNKDKTNWKKVSKEAKKGLKEKNQWHKGVREAASKQWLKKAITGERSDAEITARRQATENDVEQQLNQSNKEVVDKLGKNFALALALKDKTVEKRDQFGRKIEGTQIPLAQRNEATGEWDFTGLSQEIRAYVGADYTLNKYASIDKLVAEVQQFIGQITESGVPVSEAEAKKLIKLCGFDIERKDWRQVIAAAVAGFAVGASSSASAEALRGKDVLNIKGSDIEVHNKVTINITGDVNLDDLDLGATGGNIVKTSTGIEIIMDALVEYPDTIIKIAKHIGSAAILGGIIPSAIGALDAMKNDKGEVAVGATVVEDDTYTDYVKRLGDNPYKTQLAAIALKFADKDGKLNAKDLQAFLDHSAGKGGKLNKEELKDALQELQGIKVDSKTENKGNEPEVKQGYVADKAKVEEKSHMEDVMEPVLVTSGKHSSWEKITTMYECLENYSLSDRIRIIKLVQGINNGDYSKENLDKLLKESRKGLTSMKNLKLEGFDYDAYESALNGAPGDVKLPKKLIGCDRNGDVPPKAVFKKEQLGKVTWSITANDEEKVAENKVVDQEEQAAVYALKVNGKIENNFESEAARDKRFDELVKEYEGENIKLEKIKIEYNELVTK